MIHTGLDLAAAAKKVATEYKTLYIHGCFGAPMNDANKNRYTNNLEYNRQENRKAKILNASSDTFGFDCVCLIKGLLWGWNGDAGHQYGGAMYQANGVPDKSSNTMITLCTDVSTDFTNLKVGEFLWIPGHCGVYIGGGLAAECTHRWADGVQITRVHNLLQDDGTPGRKWEKHGKLPWISYEEENFSIGFKPMQRGARGESVRALQILLAGRGYNGNMHTPDGAFGPNTEGAVKLFQRAHGLTDDGIAGEKTLKLLLGVE